MKKPKNVSISVFDLVPNRNQPRLEFDREELESLAASIREHGVLQPLIVRRRQDSPQCDINGENIEGQRYEIIAGERRWKAAKLAGVKRVPCVLLGADERQSAVLALTENMQREQLTFFEVAFALRRLQEDYGLTQAELARRLSLSQPAVANKLRLLRLSDEEMQAIVKYGLTERHARELIRLQDGQQRKRALSRVILEQLSVAQTQRLVDSLLLPDLPPEESVPCAPAHVRQPQCVYKLQDIRVFFNSVDRLLELLRRAGVDCCHERYESEEDITLSIKIAKKAVSKAQ